MKKMIATLLLVSAILITAAQPILAHGGGLDGNGRHWNHKTGGYHYHRP